MFAPAADVVVQVVGAERVLVPVRAEVADLTRVWTLNATGAAVWDLLDGRRAVRDVVAALRVRYRVSEETAAREVAELLAGMEQAGVIRRAGG